MTAEAAATDEGARLDLIPAIKTSRQIRLVNLLFRRSFAVHTDTHEESGRQSDSNGPSSLSSANRRHAIVSALPPAGQDGETASPMTNVC